MRNSVLLVPLAAAAVALWSQPAEAKILLGVDLGPNFVLSDGLDGGDTSTGFGFAGRVGYALKVPLLEVTPEVRVGYDTLPLGDPTVKQWRATAGGRVSIGEGFRPFAFLHFGYAKATTENDVVNYSGTFLDVGGGLDLNFIPLLDIGVFLAYNKQLQNDGPGEGLNWLQIGATAALKF